VRVGLHKKSNRKVALKIYEKAKMVEIQRKKSVRREIKLMERLNHPNIIKLYEAIETDD
jgi:serine/threonine protein kinase